LPSWLLITLMALATFRLTRLVTRDDFPPAYKFRTKLQSMRPVVWTKPPNATTNYPGEWRYWWLGELVTCHWCVSAYLSAGVVGLTNVVVDFPVPVLVWFAVWGAGAVLVDRLG
jgi:hypothetical protein